MTNTIMQLAKETANNPSEYGNQWIDILKILAVFGGALTGGYFSHRLLLRRDTKTRIHLFLAFMSQLKGEVVSVWRPSDFITQYRHKIPNIVHAAAPILCDLKGEDGVRFSDMINRLCGYGDSATQEKILKDIDAITQLFDT